MKNQNYNAVDIAKFVLAIFIMLAHTASSFVVFPPYIDTFFSIYIYGVPFFFACSGFFFFRSILVDGKIIDNGCIKYWKYTKRLLFMYAMWSTIYFIFKILDWFINGISTEGLIYYFHRCLVYSTYVTIWFLPALWIAISIAYFLLKKISLRWVVIIAVVFYIIGSFMYSYTPLLEKYPTVMHLIDTYNSLFITSRNGLFNGFPFVVIGILVASTDHSLKNTLSMCLLLFIGVILESFFINKTIKGFGVDFGFLLLPFTYFFLSYLLKVKIPNHEIFFTMRNYSMLIFLSQRIFITAIPTILPENILTPIINNAFVGLMYVCFFTFFISFFIIKYSNKYPWLRYLS